MLDAQEPHPRVGRRHLAIRSDQFGPTGDEVREEQLCLLGRDEVRQTALVQRAQLAQQVLAELAGWPSNPCRQPPFDEQSHAAVDCQTGSLGERQHIAIEAIGEPDVDVVTVDPRSGANAIEQPVPSRNQPVTCHHRGTPQHRHREEHASREVRTPGGAGAPCIGCPRPEEGRRIERLSPYSWRIGMSEFLEPGLISLKEAAAMLGCHVETLRLRVRRGGMDAVRGAHGEYFVTEDELAWVVPRIRFRKRHFEPAALEEKARIILEGLLANRAVIRPRHLELIGQLQKDPRSDPHLNRLLRVHALLLAGLRTSEIADQVGISSRHVQRLQRLNLLAGAEAALERAARVERGRARRAALPIVRDIQRRVAATGFQTARRNPKSSQSGARDGQTARTVLVRSLDRAMQRHLLANGLSPEQLAAISLVGIGVDELNELILRGLPEATISV